MKLKRERIKKAIEVLEDAKKGKWSSIHDIYHGICTLVPLCYMTEWLEEQFPEWQHFSGNKQYPVPSSSKLITPLEIYTKYSSNDKNMYNKNTKYGRLRWQLIDFILERLNNELKSQRDGKIKDSNQ